MIPLRRRSLLLLALGLALPPTRSAVAQESARPAAPASPSAPAAAAAAAAKVATARAVRRTTPVVLDGVLDEPAWQSAPAASDFTESYPNPGRAATERTEVRVLYDDDALYVGVRLYDSHPDSIAAPLARRDAGGIYSDWVHVIIDSYHDRRTAFRFTVNPRGVQKDVYTYNDNNEDVNWDAVWDVATRIDSLGWVAEYRIPFSQLRFGSAPAGTERVWGFQVMRDVARRGERTAFSPWQPNGLGFTSRFGDITGITDIPTPRRLELLPYVSAKVTRAPGDTRNPFYHATDATPNAGADVRMGLPGGLTLSGTINPDFGQVEVDPAVVNLSAYETFFPEKRPFFLEGSDVFSFGQVIRNNDYGSQTFFYTRRIGRAPQRYPSGPGITYVDMPDQTPIAAAAKVTGKHGPWTVGLLDAVTPLVRADVAGPGGVRDSAAAVNPMTNTFATRLRRDFRGGRTVIGGMLALNDRAQRDEFRNLLPASAGYAGIDFEHRWSGRKYVVSGFAVQSRVNGSAPVIASLQRNSAHYFQRPDATTLTYDPTLTSLHGHAEEIAVQKNGDWFGSLAVKNVSPAFDINDVGFHGRVDYWAVSPFWGYQSNQRDSWSLNKFAGVWWNGAWNHDGQMQFGGFGSNASASFHNQSALSLNANVAPAVYSDRFLRGGPLARVPGNYFANACYNTDTRQKIWLNPCVNLNRNIGDPTWSSNVNLYADTRPTSTLHITFGPSFSRSFTSAQYTRAVADPTAAATYQTRYVFAELTQSVLSLDTRIDWTLTSKLSLQSYLQPFVAVGRYDHFKEFTQPGTYQFAVYGRDRGTIDSNVDTTGRVVSYTVDPDAGGPAAAFTIVNPNGRSHSLRGNAVLRWEYRPGSTLFFVWQQQRAGVAPGDVTFDPGHDVGAIFRERPTNIFMVKAVYWVAR